MRYALIERHRGVWPIVVQCRVLQASASGYHQHRLRQAADVGPNQPPNHQTRGRLSDTALAVHIKVVFAEMKGLGFGRMPRILRRLRYGWPRIWRELDVASSGHVWRTPNLANSGKSGLSGRTGAQATAAYRNAGDGKAAPPWP